MSRVDALAQDTVGPQYVDLVIRIPRNYIRVRAPPSGIDELLSSFGSSCFGKTRHESS